MEEKSGHGPLDPVMERRPPCSRGSPAAVIDFKHAWLVILAFALCGCLSARANAAESPAAGSARGAWLLLDGSTFQVEVSENGRKVFDDRLVFRDGMFFSESCRKFGFERSPYYVRTDGDEIQFLAETVSPTHGTMVWKGTVSGNQIDGGVRWRKERWYWKILRNFDVQGARGK
jgi:hypothetical protein